MEFKEFSNPEEEDYDIKRSFDRNNFNVNNIMNNPIEKDIYEDIFEDNNIKVTLQRYNHNYLKLIRKLINSFSKERIIEAINAYGITEEQILNPDAKVFENLRNYVVNNKSSTK